MASRNLLVGLDTVFDRQQNMVVTGSQLDALRHNLRRWALFWDGIAVVRNPNAMGRDNDDFDFLVAAGFAQNVAVDHDGGAVATTLHDVNLSALYALEDREPGSWAVDLSPGSLACQHNFLPAHHTLERRGVLVELQNVIPVPDKDVPLAEVLEFKHRRKSEMLALRHEVEDLYQDVSEAPDPALALNTGREKLVEASNNAIRVYREGAIPFRMSSEIANFNILGAIAGGAPSVLAQAPLTTILANAALGAVTIGIGFGWAHRKGNGTPFSYVAAYHSELFGD